MSIQTELISVEMETAVPGLIFRHYQGEEDIPAMVEVINRSNIVDGNDWLATVEETTNNYRHMVNCDPHQDMIFAEVHGELIGYGRCWWEKQLDGARSYAHFALLRPDWRCEGIRYAMLQFNENRLREIASNHPADGVSFLTSFAGDGETHWSELLQNSGYKPIGYFMKMVRPSLDNIPDHPLSENIEVRRGSHTEWRKIWDPCQEALPAHWGDSEWGEESFETWTQYPSFDPTLFRLGWDGAEVAGGICNCIDKASNEANGRLRGYTEDIFVRQPWRKQGLSKALIARSLQMLKEMGMTEAGLTVEAENPNGAVKLYTDMGFQRDKMSITYHKPL